MRRPKNCFKILVFTTELNGESGICYYTEAIHPDSHWGMHFPPDMVLFENVPLLFLKKLPTENTLRDIVGFGKNTNKYDAAPFGIKFIKD